MSISRSRIAALLLLAGTFLVGLIAGITLDRFSLVRERRLVPRHGPFMSEKVVRRLDRQLELSPQQEQQVRAIVERHRQKLESFWRESQPRIDAEMKAAHVEIETLLTPEQKKKFDELSERWRKMGGRNGPLHHRGGGERHETPRPGQ